jgi:hypothetical protein
MEQRRTTRPEDPGAAPRWDEVDWEAYARAGAPPPPHDRGPDLAPLFLVLDALRNGVPRELSAQFSALMREALLTLRALIDWYLERLDRPQREPRVEDIPID